MSGLENNPIQNDNRYLLSYHSDVPCISMTIHGYTRTQEFKALSEHLLETLLYHKINKVLVDIREMPLIFVDDQSWLIENWLPRARLIGHDACAVINSKHFFNRVAISNIAKNAKSIGFNFQVFEERRSAVSWLKDQK